MDYTLEQQKKIGLTRIFIGDTESSPFYPIFTDDEIASILEYYNWNLRKGVRAIAISASMQFAQMTYRERTGDIEVWNNVSLQYQKALQDLINPSNVNDLDSGLMPYFGGISWCEVGKISGNPDQVRSALTWESHTVPQIAGATTISQQFLDQNYKRDVFNAPLAYSPYAVVVE
jgi:hypothetical protein